MLRNATMRLIAAHLVLVAVSTALVLGSLYWRVGGVIDTEQRAVVEAELRGLADDYARGGIPALAAGIEQRLANPPDRDAIYLLVDADGRRIAGNLASWPPTVAPGGGWTTLDLYRTDRERPTEISALALSLPDGARLLVGRDVAARAAFDRTLWRALLWALAAITALALATGWLLSRLVHGRIAEIDGAARAIMAGALDRRVALRGTARRIRPARLHPQRHARPHRGAGAGPAHRHRQPRARPAQPPRPAGAAPRDRRRRRRARGGAPQPASTRRCARPRACSPPPRRSSTSRASTPASAPSSSPRSTSAGWPRT